jgi:hypothetical protein
MLGTMRVLEAARVCGIRRVVMASTRTVYPRFDGTPYGHPRYNELVTGAAGYGPRPRASLPLRVESIAYVAFVQSGAQQDREFHSGLHSGRPGEHHAQP